ncbi:MAG TPA: SpoIID/LytB domain-containing protein [Symbiobacteriaceae bacterium]
MQKNARRTLSALILAGFAVAALIAPLSAYAGEEVPPVQPVPAVPAPPEEAVRVGIGRALVAAEVSAPQGLYVIADGAIQLEVPGGQSVRLTLAQGQIEVAGLPGRFPGPVRLVPLAPGAPENPITYQGKRYRGEIEVLVRPKDGKLSVVNVVNVEDYLLGVVPLEMYPSWPEEALKAQAVAARTYVLASLGQFADEGFDVVDTAQSQVYGGIDAETDRTTRAVLATRGEVVVYGDELATTMFHASSGGHTENNEVIFSGRPVPYLRGVPDYDNLPGNERYSWTYRFSAEEFARKLSEANFAVGTVEAVAPAGVIGSSGRPSQWVVEGSDGQRTLSALQFRSALGLPSAPRSVRVEAGGIGRITRTYRQSDPLYVLGAGGVRQTIRLNEAFVLGAGGRPAEPAGEVTVIGPMGPRPGTVVVEGGGYGHAVGLSQWGANGLAQQGKTYREILAYYYQGTTVATRTVKTAKNR